MVKRKHWSAKNLKCTKDKVSNRHSVKQKLVLLSNVSNNYYEKPKSWFTMTLRYVY